MVQFVLPASGKFKPIIKSHATDTKEVEIKISKNSSLPDNNKSFVPFFVRINEGDTIVWKNDDLTQHTITSGQPNSTDSGNKFQSSPIASGSSFKHVFESSGSYDYYCTIHPFMKGSIMVNLLLTRAHIALA